MSAPELNEPRSIGDRIRHARKFAGINQADLAARVGVSQPAVANWESGVHDPRRLMLSKIADALGVSPDWLARGDRSPGEADKQPAAAYLRRPLRHAPVIAFDDAINFAGGDGDPHALALDYIPVTSGAEKLFAFFLDDEAMDRAFPKNTLVVVDYGDKRPADGAFALFSVGGAPLVRRWREGPPRLEPVSDGEAYGPVYLDRAPAIIGCVRVAIRFH
ncbi:MAG: helix-turn-helix domain-containing protein [Parvularculaceae bacterium]|nr:helix-turn-helix domain-containing protein [Parvularculaceae bacterium]